MTEIRWLVGESERTEPLEGDGPLGLGRGADNLFVLDDPGVSRHHARIVASDRGWAIEDLGSSNGTWVNGQRVARAFLRNGDCIRLGGVELVFRDDPAPPPLPGVAVAGAGSAVPDADESEGTSYYLARGGERLGPYTWTELTGFAANGQVAAADVLWGPGLERWTAAHAIPGLLPAAAGLAVGPPPVPRSRGDRSMAKVLLVVLPVAVLGLLLGFLALQLTGSGGGGDGGNGWEASVLGLDDADWQSYPDLEVERRKIDEKLRGFQNALRAGDVAQAVSFIAEERQGAYGALFENRPEAMASFADVLEASELSFFGTPEEPSLDLRFRTAEYTVTIDDFDFYVRWAKVEDRWVLLDF